MKRILALLVLAAPLIANAADSNPDATFYKKAAEAGIAEVDAANLAESKSSSQPVKDFAAMMVTDHTAANDKLKALAATKNISLPTSASVMQISKKAELDVLSGDTFDKAYIKSQVKAHHQAVYLFKKESTSGQDADAKAFATATLPTLQAHLKKIKSIAADAGVTTKAG